MRLILHPTVVAVCLTATLPLPCLGSQPAQPGITAPEPAKEIVLEKGLPGGRAAELANKVSRLIGTEVRVPAGVPKLTSIDAGTYTADELLGLLASRIMEARLKQGSWRRIFVFRPPGVAPGDQPQCALRSAGNLTINRRELPFDGLALAAARAADCRVEIDKAVPGVYSLRCKDLPVEQAMDRLAAGASMKVSTVVSFEYHSERDAHAKTEEELEDEAEQAAAEEASLDILAELELCAAITDLTGWDPLDSEFPWASIRGSVWERLGFTPFGLGAFYDRMQDRIANRQLTLEQSRRLLSGLFPIGNFDPMSGEPVENREPDPRSP